MKSFFEERSRFSISVSCLLGFVLTIGSASLFSGCDNDKSQTQMTEQQDKPADIAKDSMSFYKDAHLKKGGAPKK
jgi:hypothetical protein